MPPTYHCGFHLRAADPGKPADPIACDPAVMDNVRLAVRLDRARVIAKKLAARLETVMRDRKVRGSHALDLGTWCRKSNELIFAAKNL